MTHWPFAFDVEIFHDIPFGAVSSRQDRPFFPASWVDVCDGRRGVAFFHQGTPKHWVSENSLVNLLAWGEDTDAIHNGLGRDRWLKSFDQRLNGSHRIESAVFVHPGNWQTGAVAEAALAYRFPPVVVSTGSHPGSLPLEADVLAPPRTPASSLPLSLPGGRRSYAGPMQPEGNQRAAVLT